MTAKNILIINNEKYPNDPGWSPQIEKALKKIDDVQCTVKHFSEISSSLIEDVNPQSIILTGRVGHHWEPNEIENNYVPKLNILMNVDVPILGICAGLQLLAIMHGSTVGKMHESEENILEEGYIEHTIVKEDDIFAGLNKTFYCRQFHRDEVKEIPDEFELLASSDMCKVQVLKHTSKPIYGVQFHPEWFNESYPDGKVILSNFLNMNKDNSN